MTAHSQIVPAGKSQRGSQLAVTSSATAFEVPPAIDRKLGLSPSKFSSNGYSFDEVWALGVAKRDGLLDAIPVLADKAAQALVPIEYGKLVDRLTLLGMSMPNGKDAAQVQAWLHETARLLENLPACVILPAIDECVKEPGRVFCPTVGEIIEKAAEPLRKREHQAARLRRMAIHIEQGSEIPDLPEAHWGMSPPPKPAEPNCTPEQAAAILAEYGLPSGQYGLAAQLKPAEHQTRAEMIAKGQTPPPIAPDPPQDPLTV